MFELKLTATAADRQALGRLLMRAADQFLDGDDEGVISLGDDRVTFGVRDDK